MTKLTSDTITALRFPLILAVVMQHTYIINRPIGVTVPVPAGRFPIFDIFAQVVQAEVATVAVPLFFFISGYLFFHGLEKFNKQVYLSKLKRRMHSLVIPYFIWNTLFLLYVEFIHVVAPSLLLYKKSLIEMSLPQILNCYWDLSQGLIPLWFIRDLIIINLFAPVIYFLLHHRYSWLVLFAFLGLYLSGHFHYEAGVGMRAAFPYMLGAWFSINGKDMATLSKLALPLLLAFVAVISIDCYLSLEGTSNFAIYHFGQILGILAIIAACSIGVKLEIFSVNKFLAKGSFFVFVFHMFIIYIPAKLWIYVLPVNTFTCIVALLAIPLIVGYACIGIYWILNKMCPSVMKVAMGER